MKHTCEAFYLPSDIGMPIVFDFKIDFEPENSKEGFFALAKEFNDRVQRFGVNFPFPDEIIAGMSDEGFDRLLSDCEFLPEKTFFILTDSKDRFFNLYDGIECKMSGNNGTMTVFSSLDGNITNVVETKKALQVFERIKQTCVISNKPCNYKHPKKGFSHYFSN